MNKMGSAAKVKLNSFDDLFRTEQPQAGTEQVQEIALSELHEFKGHPFKVLVVVVFPTPPFWFPITITLHMMKFLQILLLFFYIALFLY